jgi:hypothetical protein
VTLICTALAHVSIVTVPDETSSRHSVRQRLLPIGAAHATLEIRQRRDPRYKLTKPFAEMKQLVQAVRGTGLNLRPDALRLVLRDGATEGGGEA